MALYAHWLLAITDHTLGFVWQRLFQNFGHFEAGLKFV